MEDTFKNILNIRFVKLRFCLVFPDKCILPRTKASAIRGGIGEMLLRANCIKDRDCKNCDFEDECIVQRIMRSKFKNVPESSEQGDSIGYVIECLDEKEHFFAGDTLEFSLTLFGRNIVYFNQYLQAIYALGQNGLGREAAQFQIDSIFNSDNEPILDGYNVYMERYKVRTLDEYVQKRMETVQSNPVKILFSTPLSQKYKGELLRQLDLHAIVRSAQRRIYMLSEFEEIDGGKAFYDLHFDVPQNYEQKSEMCNVRRHSSRQNADMMLKGITGWITIDHIPEELLKLLLACEIAHIGKNTSFGFGKIQIV